MATLTPPLPQPRAVPPNAASPPGASPRSRAPRNAAGAAWLAPLALGAALLALWEVLTHPAHVNALILPAPEAVVAALREGITSGALLSAARTTLGESLAGFALGAAVALPAGYAVARSRWLAWALQPYLAASQALPAVALAPLLVVWLGYGLVPIAVLGALIVFFPAAIATTLGLRSLDRDVLDAARVDGADRWALLGHIELPLALPAILAGLRTSLTLSLTGAVVGEFVLGTSSLGLGSLLTVSLSQLDTPLIFAILIVLALLAAALYGGARLIERQLSYLEEE
ncbi:MAG TPA: ABC transporter permease [Ktedonobacterales bacterium]|nr:ABC transporter permease [Ktedonobacterales bacterium]